MIFIQMSNRNSGPKFVAGDNQPLRLTTNYRFPDLIIFHKSSVRRRPSDPT